MTDHDHMQNALSLALKGKGFTSPNPCVGAVVVKNGVVLGKGWHRAAGMAHAEVEAIEDAQKNFPANTPPITQGATIYVTLEPCNHFGKTPPCTHKIINAGITRVVVGCKDPNPYVSGGGIRYLRENGIQVECGLLERETQTLIEAFIWYTQNKKLPFVILKCASTLDGRIATSTGDSQWITNETSRGQVHTLRNEVDAILIGSGTLHADNPSLTARIKNTQTRDPIRIILDSRLSIDETARVITQQSTANTILVVGPGASFEKRQRLEKMGAGVLEVPLKNGRLDLGQLMIKLGSMSIQSLLIEGGGKVAAAALKEGIVNKVLFFLAPKFLGGSDGVPVFDGKGPQKICDAFKLNQMTVERLEGDVLITGYLKDPPGPE
ncbi:MAG: bifunctional diaminohydroxyphosphoribosylaminopyrimidine deaminase/5-amino-6-(5-phosphoribosylamino)uracil reductase RibD [Deltaproteobacteria bacterium]|nr:MAG: bifunctional diaminohydroxyphosphoribosylaminopyrimidine deaminase/5-amino-6-(5-phosphoribosylamino)uracil reductase RibD [Deltaproteobacteria bacterium]